MFSNSLLNTRKPIVININADEMNAFRRENAQYLLFSAFLFFDFAFMAGLFWLCQDSAIYRDLLPHVMAGSKVAESAKRCLLSRVNFVRRCNPPDKEDFKNYFLPADPFALS